VAKSIVVDEAFVLRIPDQKNLPGVAPLLCAGITTYSPLRHWKVGKGQKVGIVGLGGLGHMGVKFARAFGAHVVLFTTSAGKTEDAKRLGAHEVVISKDAHKNVNGVPYASPLNFSHSSFLRTMQEIFGVDSGKGFPFLGGAASAHDLSDLFKPGTVQ